MLEPSKKSLIFMRQPVDKIALQLAMISVYQKCRVKFSNANFSAPMVQIGKFQCLSHRAFPEFFKTHPTLICRSVVQASTSLQTNRQCYLIAPVQSIVC